MIDSLNGEVLSIGLDHAVIECAGVGYRFLATPLTLGRLTRGEQRRVMTTMVVKDDGVTLYGFGDPEAREMFHKLQTVSGLGPKLALAALSVFDAGELSAHIASGDAKSIQTVPGVGKKMAERIVLELKDKVDAFIPAADAPAAAGAAPTRNGASLVSEQVVEALLGLGFQERSARPVVDALVEAEPAESASALLRSALSQLGKK
ncbi:Holliday junction branch migration protein RuvA [Corynebacterium wankanglinii]|uniref:Holliday junction branch migration complex subunit RuvA n=1 Tax=Corynebacterium wankanglinii TaxID=2735136 RepID=A0A838CL50_9CORY|nr:Holliday junction branch migration protein RuvA [Corynebacterium wankanglinii]MBA1835758.1 Holliday junction branch migration protein RuvA [Corynebacterium wankanglinii]